MTLPTDIDLLNTIDSIRNRRGASHVSMHEILDSYPDNKGFIIRRLGQLSDRERNILEYTPGSEGGYRITGRTNRSASADVAVWVTEWTERKQGGF